MRRDLELLEAGAIWRAPGTIPVFLSEAELV